MRLDSTLPDPLHQFPLARDYLFHMAAGHHRLLSGADRTSASVIGSIHAARARRARSSVQRRVLRRVHLSRQGGHVLL